MKRHHVYILECRGGYFYTGYTTNLRRRLSQHKAGKGSRFTRSHLPVKLVYHESYNSIGEALRRELAIKRLPRGTKVSLTDKEKRPVPSKHLD